MTDFKGRGTRPDSRPGTSSAKMMLAFVIRQCEIDLGHPPTAAELAAWANSGGSTGEQLFLFGRPITEAEARVILKRPSRLVSAKGAEALARWGADGDQLRTENVVALAAVRERLAARRRTARHLSRKRG